MLKHLIAGTALLALAAPLVAQTTAGSRDDPGTPRTPLATDRGYDKPQARTEAINAQTRADVARANSLGAAGTVEADADLQSMYDSDMEQWAAQMRSRSATMAADQRAYERNRRAYADAMYVWRMQVRDCERGVRFACNRPTPNPGDFIR